MTEKNAAIPAVSRTLTTLVDGTVRLKIDFEPRYRESVMRQLGEPGTPIAVVQLDLESAQAQMQQEFIAGEKIKTPYGEQAKALRLSAFFRNPNIWQAIDSDPAFLSWLRQQPCAYCQSPPNEHHPTEAAHVRRVANGAGVAVKPEYSAIPLCHQHHALQHQQGESALGGKEWFDKKRIDYVSRWAWEALKNQLGFGSWSEVPPNVLNQWATQHNLQHHLPAEYRGANDNT